MFEDESRIIQDIKAGHKMLLERPELWKLSINELLDTLDDGIEEMTNLRWGVVAYVCIEKIKDYSYKGLVEELSVYQNWVVLYPYIAYILQKKHHIRMVQLLIEANRCGKVMQIAPFAQDNLVFEEIIELNEVLDFLRSVYDLQEDIKGRLLSNYAKLITNRFFTESVYQLLNEDRQKESTEFMPYLIRAAYTKGYACGNCLLEKLLNEVGDKIIFIDSVIVGLHISVCKEIQLFEQYFQIIKKLIQDNSIWEKMIPIFIEYLKFDNQELSIKEMVLDKLRGIIEGTLDEKRIYINSVVYCEKLQEVVANIFNIILESSVEKDAIVLQRVQTYFYRQREKINIEEMLQQLHHIFIVNKYTIRDYKEFFQIFDLLCRMCKDKQEDVWMAFLKAMFTGEMGSFIFAVGLYEEVLEVSCLSEMIDQIDIGTQELLLILRLIIYHSVDAKRVCRLAFELAGIVSDDEEEYIKVCMDELYSNYCYSSNTTAKLYIGSQKILQEKLAREIISRYENDNKLQKKAWAVLDFQPSEERRRIYQIVQGEQNEKMNKLANEKSVFAQIFSRRVMKYGNRSAYVQTINQGQQTYSVSPYVTSKYEAELPALYINHPIEWERHRHIYLQMRRDYIASNYKRLSFAVKREG